MNVTQVEGAIIGLGASIAALLYLARQLRKLGAAVTFFTEHPAAHKRLADATEANTAAIDRLTAMVEKNGSP